MIQDSECTISSCFWDDFFFFSPARSSDPQESTFPSPYGDVEVFLRSVSHILHDLCLSLPSPSERNDMMSSPGVSILTNVLPCNFGDVGFRDALSPPLKDHRIHLPHFFAEERRTCHPWRNDVRYGPVEIIPPSDREGRSWTRNGVQIRYFAIFSVTILTKAPSSLCQSDETHRIEHILKYITFFFSIFVMTIMISCCDKLVAHYRVPHDVFLIVLMLYYEFSLSSFLS